MAAKEGRMTNHPDQSALPKDFANWVFQQAIADGVLRIDLEKRSGQTCAKWRPYVEQVAAERGYTASRHRDAGDRRLTRFVMDKGPPVNRSTVAGDR